MPFPRIEPPALKLSGLDYSISYIKGELNIVADYLSRDAVVQIINLIHHDVLPDSSNHNNQLEYSREVIKKHGSVVLKPDHRRRLSTLSWEKHKRVMAFET